MKLAVLADVHGNGEALHAVLADVARRGGADHLLVLGDIALLGPDPGEVVELLLAWDAIAVFGNADRFLLDTDWRTLEPEGEEERADRALCLWALGRLGQDAEGWLRALPFERTLVLAGQRILLVHGSPRSEREEIRRDTPDDSVREMIAGVQADLVLYGHTHEPLDRVVEGVRLINPGAVGYPQGEEASARYLLLTWDGEWQVEFCRVQYDVEATIARLMAAQRPYRLWLVEMLRRAAHVPMTTLE